MKLCGYGLCHTPATETVTSPTAIGQRVEMLCPEHAARRRELNAELLATWNKLGVGTQKELAA